MGCYESLGFYVLDLGCIFCVVSFIWRIRFFCEYNSVWCVVDFVSLVSWVWNDNLVNCEKEGGVSGGVGESGNIFMRLLVVWIF